MRPVESLGEAPFTHPRPGHGTLGGTTQDSGVRRSASLGLPAKGHNWDISHVTGLQSCVI
jgi:hypothetical protein